MDNDPNRFPELLEAYEATKLELKACEKYLGELSAEIKPMMAELGLKSYQGELGTLTLRGAPKKTFCADKPSVYGLLVNRKAFHCLPEPSLSLIRDSGLDEAIKTTLETFFKTEAGDGHVLSYSETKPKR